jgi:peptide/nickel transport system ATP-binding protein
MANILDIKDLVTNFYTYEGVVKALNKVSFRVEHGSTFGLVGESGCGKSVTVRSIMQIVQSPGIVESGEINFSSGRDGSNTSIDLLKQSEKFMQNIRGNEISMIFQEPNSALNPIMCIGEQIAESYTFHQKNKIIEKILNVHTKENIFPQVSVSGFLKPLYTLANVNPDSFFLRVIKKIPVLKNWDNAILRTGIAKSVELLGLFGIPNPEKIVTQYPHNLSGGMKQRVVIAIALASNPVLLIADEATSNLDVTVQAQILDLLNDLKTRGIISSILLITHDLGVVAETCDRVGVMYAGNLCELASTRQIFEEPKHPYTKALLDSVPKAMQTGVLKSIAGNVPNLVNPPLGCRFHPRCDRAMERCKQDFPKISKVDGDHFVACYLYS